jgi:hypothetical protein
MSPWLIHTSLVQHVPLDSACPCIRRTLLAQLSSNVCQPLLAIEAESLETAVTQHLHDLGVFLSFLLERELTLFVVVLVLSPPPVLTTAHKISVTFSVVAAVCAAKERARGISTHPFPLFLGISTVPR